MKKVLITGGCGFIGSHLVEKLLNEGWEPIIVDNLSEQIHKEGHIIPKVLLGNCNFIHSDIRDIEKYRNLLIIKSHP